MAKKHSRVTDAQRKHVQELLLENDLPWVKIALVTRTSRTTVEKEAARLGIGPTRKAVFYADLPPLGTRYKASRCPGCGAMTYQPCHACRVNQAKAEESIPKFFPRPD